VCGGRGSRAGHFSLLFLLIFSSLPSFLSCRGAPGPSHTQPHTSGARKSSAARWPRVRHRSARLLRSRKKEIKKIISSIETGGTEAQGFSVFFKIKETSAAHQGWFS
jgi:hypothetical protein